MLVARHMRELVQQMKELGLCADDVAANDGLQLEAAVHSTMKSDQFPHDQFGAVRVIPQSCSSAWVNQLSDAALLVD